MHGIALCSVATVALMGYCFMHINKKKMIPATLQNQLQQALQSQDVSKALTLCDQHPSSLAHVVKETFQKAGQGESHYKKSELENAASETIFHEETRFMLWVNMLNAFAAVAPMIGLLATVSGMIQSFETLKQGKAKAADFAGGIGEAMVGTAGGLLVAIPAMFCYFYFKNQLQAKISELSRTVSRLLGTFLSGSVAPHESSLPSEDSSVATPNEASA